MKSIATLATRQMRRSLMKDRRGQTISLVSGTVISFMVLVFIIFAVLFGIATLNPSTFFTAGSVEGNAVGNLTGNLTAGVGEFGRQIPLVLSALGVVLILAAIVLLVLYVRRMQGASGGGNAGL